MQYWAIPDEQVAVAIPTGMVQMDITPAEILDNTMFMWAGWRRTRDYLTLWRQQTGHRISGHLRPWPFKKCT